MRLSPPTYRRLKRGLDVVASGLGLLVLGPVLVCLAVAVRLSIGAPVLFRQQRPGRRARLFTLYKFRTMTGADGTGPDAERLTRLGRFLRRTSLDELPQLFNILRGDMSFVGPRPLLERYLAHYTPHEQRRHDVPPGLTGWAQIHGRNHLSWEERLALDVWYVDHASLSLDLHILIRTLGLVLRGTGIHDAPAEHRADLDAHRPPMPATS